MNTVTYQDFIVQDGSSVTYAIIDLGNGNFQSMPKADYDKLPSELVNQAVPNA
jgi:hypothetical protein